MRIETETQQSDAQDVKDSVEGTDQQLADARAQRSTALSVRPARAGDCSAIARIYNEAIASGQSTMDTQCQDASAFEIHLDATRRESLLVGEVGAERVAWGITKCYSERPGYRFAGETSVYVAEGHQGRGYGTIMLDAVMGSAKALGYRHLVAKILAVNEASVRFHERFGFEVVGRQRAIGFLKGQWHDVVIMQHIVESRPLTEDTS